jgi:hypothetical protein
MASILEEAEAEALRELGEEPKTIEQQAEEQATIELQEHSAEASKPVEPTEDFFVSAEKFLEPAAPAQKSNADIFLGLVSSKRAGEIDESDKEFFNALGDEDQYKVAQARKDIPLDDAQARRIFEVEKSKMPSAPTSWEDWYNLGGDAFDVVKNVSKLGVKVGLGAAEFGRDVVKASDMQVSDEEFDKNLKKAKSSFYSFMSPAFEIPESVLWATEKAKEGGFGWADAAGEKLGLVSPEDRFENWKGRRLVSQAQAEYFREHPTIYGRLLDSPLAKDALSYIAKSQMESPEELAKRTNVSVEEARSQQDAMSRQQVDQLTSEMESELPEENIRVRTAGEFLLPGEVGMGTMGAVSLGFKGTKAIAQGLKYIGKSADEIAEINKAAQALQKTRFAEMMQKRTQRAESVARGAGKVEEVMQSFKPITEKATGILGKVAPPVLGGLAGYSVSGESPMTGILTGALGGTAARSLFKGTKLGLQIPTFVREVAEARKVAPLGKTFETLGKTAEGSALKAKILSRGGKTIDNILSNSVEYARSGIHGTTLALATGALESADPEEMKQMLADGLAITLGGRALQHIKGKMMGGDPIIAQRERISDDSRIHRRYQEADPETQSNLDQISDFDNAIAAKQSKLNESESDLANLMVTYKGSGEDAKKLKLAQSEVEKNKIALDQVKRANVQTRNEFGREFLKTYANLQDITNGVLKTGQNNVGFNILSTDQIYQKLRNDPANNNVPDADLVQMASQAGFYSNPSQQGLVFDRRKPSIVINADSIRERINLFGESPTEALNHETSHFIDLVPEFQSALSPVRSMLFQNEIRDAAGNIKATTPGIFSKAKLVELFNDGYLRHLDPQGKEAFTKLNKLWDESRGQLDENKVANYMKSELMADLLGEVSSRHLSKDLDSATLAMWDRARIKAKKNLLDRAIDRFYGFGGRGDIVTAANTRAEFPPEAMAAARDAMRQIVALNAEISPPAQEPDMPAISKAQMMKNSALLNRFGKDSPLFKSEFKVKVFDKDGNQIGESMPVTTPNPREGTFQSTDVGMKKLSGYGDIPVEAQGLQVPDGGTLVVSRDLVMQPDGVTPVMYEAKEAKKVAAERKRLITEALDTDDYGTPNRFEPVAEGSETYRGTFTPAQIKAIQDMPESLVPKTLKENMLKVNEAIARGDGTRFIVDYAAVMNDNGKYQAFSPKMYDLVPIGMHLSKAGNFLVTTISVGRIFDKMRLWNERMPGRLNFWDNNLERTFDDFTKYLNNWQQGKPGKTNLDADPKIAETKAVIFNDLLNLYDKGTEFTNLDRTTIPRRKGDPRNKDANRTIMSIRVDHIAELLANENATKLPVNYDFAKKNFMPERMEGEVPTQEKRQIDENVKFANPPSEKSAIDALSSNKREYFGMHRGLDDGYPVGIRIDIPAFTSKGVYVVTVHEKKKGGERGQVGERIGYDTIAKVDNPIFFSNEVGAKKIKSGEANKFPVATVEGQFNSSREIPEDINEWTPVGYNPREHSYFYDKTNDEPVLSGDEAISVGNTVFVKNPVYGDKANFAFMPERPIEERFPTPERGFYSGLQQTIDQKVQGKFASPDQLKAIISNPQNVKAEELKWSGVLNEIDRLSAENQGKVPKDKVMDYLRNEGAVKFEEATLGENTEANKIAQKFGIEIQKEYEETTFVDKDGDEMDFEDLPKALQNALSKNIPPKYAEYQLPGGENYREVVMTMPQYSELENLTFSYSGLAGGMRMATSSRGGSGMGNTDALAKADWERQYGDKIKGSQRRIINSYISSHFPEVQNYVAHMRLNERTDAEGNQGLFVEEFQSDRHQAGREKGYSGEREIPEGYELIDENQSAREAGYNVPSDATPRWSFKGPGISSRTYFSKQEAIDAAWKNDSYSGDSRIPDAPFRKDWGVQLFKRALRDAVESGKSWIGWTTGIEQVNRYENDMRSKVDEITWQTINGNKSIRAIKGNNVFFGGAIDKDGNIRGSGTEADGKQVSDVFGKAIASKVSEDYKGSLAGDDLTVGGEGMKGFYDQILPKEIGKYVSKMGGKVEKSEIDQSEAQYKVNRDSQPLPYRLEFSDSPEVLARFATANEAWAEAEKRSQTPIWKVNITPEMAGKVKGGQLQFMPQRPVGKTQTGYDYSYLDQALASGTDGRVALTRPIRADEALPLLSQRIPITEEIEKDSFDYTRPAEVVFYQHENKPVSFKFDPELIEKPVFKDAAIEHAGKNVQLAMADRQTATGGDMGGIIFPWLKSNANAIITGDDGINYRAVWANNEWKPVLSMKNKNINFNAFNLLTYLMGPDAHASNAREVRNISNEIENAKISREQKDLFLILANIGVKKQKRADQQKNIKSANDYIEETKKLIKESSDKEEIKKLNNEIKLKEKDIELAKLKYDRFLETSDEELIKPVITKYKTAYTRFKGGTGSENTFIKNKTALDEFKKTKSFKNLLKIIKNKQLISLDDTFKGRKASIAQILGLTIDDFNVDNVLDQTMDFKNGRTNHIVGSVELSRNPDLMAVYLGDDPKQAKRMTAQEAKAASQLKADPDFVPHEAYSWVMLGPVDGNNFLNSNPKTHLEYFPDFQETYANIQEDAGKKQKILEGNETTLMGAMRDNTQMPLAMPAISGKK